ncbi:hypothetical protein JL722_8463 [Aureococcus anophagefferens]|nr:hypothetical protein JL722_8463 [Aureococcus anophagefferens]
MVDYSLKDLASTCSRLEAIYRNRVCAPAPRAPPRDDWEGRAVELIRALAEMIIYGERHSEAFFEYFVEKQMMGLLVALATAAAPRLRIQVQVLQTVAILVQNVRHKTSLYLLLSSNYVNALLGHGPFRRRSCDEELFAHFVSLLKTLSLRLDAMTAQFFVDDSAADVFDLGDAHGPLAAALETCVVDHFLEFLAATGVDGVAGERERAAAFYVFALFFRSVTRPSAVVAALDIFLAKAAAALAGGDCVAANACLCLQAALAAAPAAALTRRGLPDAAGTAAALLADLTTAPPPPAALFDDASPAAPPPGGAAVADAAPPLAAALLAFLATAGDRRVAATRVAAETLALLAPDADVTRGAHAAALAAALADDDAVDDAVEAELRARRPPARRRGSGAWARRSSRAAAAARALSSGRVLCAADVRAVAAAVDRANGTKLDVVVRAAAGAFVGLARRVAGDDGDVQKWALSLVFESERNCTVAHHFLRDKRSVARAKRRDDLRAQLAELTMDV